MSTFATLGLRAELLRALGDAGYTEPTPIQAQAIPLILQGRDVLAAAQTGTGKTAGFTLPLLQLLTDNPLTQRGGRRPIRALILTPTRELAAQVEESVRTYGAHLPQVKTAVIFGGVGMKPQIDALQKGVDILVATPGRLLDLVNQRWVDLSRVETFVLDEADRMLDMGFIRDIRRVLALLPNGRQNLLFSATFSDEIRALAGDFLHEPANVEVARRNAESELVTQAVYFAEKADKRDLLVHLLVEEDVRQAIVFTRTKHGADRLAKLLARDGVSAVPIHGDRSQGQRTRALADFKAGKARLLVATDIAARGLDIEQLPHVINYELPNVPEDYVHRIGRTGRAGSPGRALSLVASDERAYLASIEKLMKKQVDRLEPKGFNYSEPIPAEPVVVAPAPRPRGGGGGGGRGPQSQPRHPQRHPSQPASVGGGGQQPRREARPQHSGGGPPVSGGAARQPQHGRVGGSGRPMGDRGPRPPRQG